MKYLIYVFFLCLCHGTIISQSLTEKDIQGVWEVEQVVINLEFESEIQKERINSLKKGFHGAQFFFTNEHRFTIELNPEAPPTFDDEMFIDIYDWRFIKETNHINIGKNVMDIIVMKKTDTYYFDFQFGLVLQMTKIKDIAVINLAEKIEKLNTKNKN